MKEKKFKQEAAEMQVSLLNGTFLPLGTRGYTKGFILGLHTTHP